MGKNIKELVKGLNERGYRVIKVVKITREEVKA